MRLISFAILAVGLLPLARVEADTIAYDNAGGITAVLNGNNPGIQNYGNDLGLDFTVNGPIRVTELGAFDNGNPNLLNGVNGTSGITVGIFNTTTGLQVGPSVTFSASNVGTQINGDAFLPTNITLLDGNYTIVAYNDGNYNANGSSPNTTSTENSGGGLISFVGGGRYSGTESGLAFPTTMDGGPSNRYDAGTFEFVQAPEPTTMSFVSLGIIGLVLAASRCRKR
jgi:hypothetical protein